MEFANQPQRNGKSFAEAAHSMFERRHVVGNFLHIIDGNSRRFVVLEQEKDRKARIECPQSARRGPLPCERSYRETNWSPAKSRRCRPSVRERNWRRRTALPVRTTRSTVVKVAAVSARKHEPPRFLGAYLIIFNDASLFVKDTGISLTTQASRARQGTNSPIMIGRWVLFSASPTDGCQSSAR